MKVGFGLGVLACLSLVGGCEAEGQGAEKGVVRLERLGGGKTYMVAVEIADSMEERAAGLMFRQSLGAEEGMLFVWPETTHNVFWMKNTPLPLDMLFIEKGRVVGVIENAKPFDETPLDPGVLSDRVLEVNAGWAKRHQVGVGSRFF